MGYDSLACPTACLSLAVEDRWLCPQEVDESSDLEANYLRDRAEHNAWEKRSPEMLAEQIEIQNILRRHAGAVHFGDHCFIARGARIFTGKFSIGRHSWVAAGALIRGDVAIGANCSVNPFAHIAGTVRIGNGVRIASSSIMMGFNHGYTRTDIPIRSQPGTALGIRVGNETWIGAGAIIVDGVEIGDECIVAAGAVVTKSFSPFSVIGGNPARLIKSRLEKVE